jgi:radical SAM superfamily enzyme YgiQ (UPF0313 family)
MHDPRKILLVYPKFATARFMGHYELACEMAGAKQIIPPLGLLTVAALLPAEYEIHLTDSNLAELKDEDIIWSDLVMTGGMLTQQEDTLRIIERAHTLGRKVVIGGPDVSSSPVIYETADYRVIGEAEGVLLKMLTAWESGESHGVFEQELYSVDMRQSPVPRFDLIDPSNYLQIGLQFSRGCPFTCEFCDIIELYGRVPRTKAISQVITELEAIYKRGHRGLVYFVDDNLIGNKRELRPMLREITQWQGDRGNPFQFYTAASLNLADDAELLSGLREAGFISVFIGIETGDEAVLNGILKKQNTRRDIAESIHIIQESGLLVTAGFIVGLDGESPKMADAMVELIERSAIGICLVSLLYALPNTQLSRRLKVEGRLFPDIDLSRFTGSSATHLSGLNFETERPKAQIVSDFAKVLSQLYDPDSFFRRIDATVDALRPRSLLGTSNFLGVIADLRRWFIFTRNLHSKYPELVRPFWRSFWRAARRNPRSLKAILIMVGMYPHLRQFTECVRDEVNSTSLGQLGLERSREATVLVS